jgi:hypothetical protein
VEVRSPSFFTNLKEWQGLIAIKKTGQNFDIFITLCADGDKLIKLGVLNHELGHGFIHFDMLMNNMPMESEQENEASSFAGLMLKQLSQSLKTRSENGYTNNEYVPDDAKIERILTTINTTVV